MVIDPANKTALSRVNGNLLRDSHSMTLLEASSGSDGWSYRGPYHSTDTLYRSTPIPIVTREVIRYLAAQKKRLSFHRAVSSNGLLVTN